MSVVAWDGKILAADMQATYGGTPIKASKIWKCGHDIIGCTGEIQEALLFRKWYMAGKKGNKPIFKEGFSAYVVKNKQLWKYESMLFAIRMNVSCWGGGKWRGIRNGGNGGRKNGNRGGQDCLLFRCLLRYGS